MALCKGDPDEDDLLDESGQPIRDTPAELPAYPCSSTVWDCLRIQWDRDR